MAGVARGLDDRQELSGKLTLAVVLWCWQPRHGRPRGNISYTPDLVNLQARAVRANLAMPHEIVCITDFPANQFNPDIRLVPLWEDLRFVGGCYCRLKAFAPEMREIIGPRFVSMDLDMCVVGKLDALFDHDEPLKLWRSETVRHQPYNGSMFQMTAGAAAHVWRNLDINLTPRLARMEGYRGTDQALLAYLLGPDVPVWTDRDGVIPLDRCGPRLPAHARVVFSPGGRKVTDPGIQRQAPWLREAFARYEQPAAWVA